MANHKFWMCWIESQGMLRKRHFVKTEAIAECERLVGANNAPCVLLEAITQFSPKKIAVEKADLKAIKAGKSQAKPAF